MIYPSHPDDDLPTLSDLLENSYPTAEEWRGAETEDRLNGVEHPSWCTQPPGHPPYWTRFLPGLGVMYENCEPEPAHA